MNISLLSSSFAEAFKNIEAYDVARVVAIVILLVASGLLLVLIHQARKSELASKRYIEARSNLREALLNSMSTSGNSAFNYADIDAFLRSRGGYYRLPKGMTPLGYLIMRFTCGFVGALIGLLLHPLVAPLFAVVGYLLPQVLLEYLNTEDNDKMMEDIKSVYDTLKLQSKAGVYISSALLECYLVVKNPRLKTALNELSKEISSTNDIETAVDNFSLKFNNDYLTTLAVIIKQSLKTGKAAQAFDDINAQIEVIQALINAREQKRIDRDILLCQVFIYIGVITMVIYICVLNLLESASMM